MKKGSLSALWNLRNSTEKPVDYARLLRFYRVFGPHYANYWGLLLLAYGSLLLMVAGGLLVPWPLKLVIDHLVLQEPLPENLAWLTPLFTGRPLLALALLALSIIGIRILVAIVSYLNKFYLAAVGDYIVADIRQRVFAHLQRLSLTFHKEAESGDLVYRMMEDTAGVKELLIAAPQQLVQRVVTIVAVTAMMFWLEWRLALIAIAVVPLIYYFMRTFGAGVEKATKVQKKHESKLTSMVVENVKALALIKAYGQEAAAIVNFEIENQASLEGELAVIALDKTFSRIVDMIVAVATSLVLYVGGRVVLATDLPPGTLLLFVAYLAELYGPIDKLSAIMISLAKNQVAGHRVMELVESKLVMHDRRNALPVTTVAGRIEFRNVTFAYQGHGPLGFERRQAALKAISFTVEPGETVALVGQSGAGKSTLINLLMRFYDPQKGTILLDGQDLRRYQLRALRNSMTIVLQDAMLFSRTVRENIGFGKANATVEEIIAAAKLAQAHEFIEALPDGYATVIHEGGSNLSGGQRQRINIARAILRDTPLLLLDEPATALDARAAAQVRAALTELTKGRTTFVIAHNFETIVHADQILVLDEGQVVQQGTHAVLLRISPRYRELYELQFGVQASAPAQAAPEATPEATPAPLLQPMMAGTP